MLAHYGYDTGSVAERIDGVCAGFVDATEILVELGADLPPPKHPSGDNPTLESDPRQRED